MVKAFKWYPADDEKKIYKRKTNKPTKLKSGITAGTVLILLSGRFRGKRVVFLKQLESGLLLVTGPYKVNGVPLKRVNQAYVMATSAKVDIKGVDVKATSDKLFAKEKKSKKSSEAKFFAESKLEKKEVSKERLELQKKVDAPILAVLKADKEKMMKKYLNARFSLNKNMKPHEMKF